MLRERWRDRGERCGKGAQDASGGDREGERKRFAVDVSKKKQVTSKPGCLTDPGTSLAGARWRARWCPAWRRREPGLRLLHGTGEGRMRHCPFGFASGREGEARALHGCEYRCGFGWRTGS